MRWNFVKRALIYDRRIFYLPPKHLIHFEHGFHTTTSNNGHFTNMIKKLFVVKTQKEIEHPQPNQSEQQQNQPQQNQQKQNQQQQQQNQKQQKHQIEQQKKLKLKLEQQLERQQLEQQQLEQQPQQQQQQQQHEQSYVQESKKKNRKEKKNSQVIKKRNKRKPNLLMRSEGNSLELPEFLFNSKNNTSSNNNSDNRSNKLPDVSFDPYISHEEYLERLSDGDLITNNIRINPRNFRLAYLTNPLHESEARDIVIEGVEARNRAFPGDEVAVQILPREEWRDEGATKTGKVVYLVNKIHSRTACGMLRPYRNHRFGFALFSPVDRRLPRVMVPLKECPQHFIENPDKYRNTLFIGNINSWSEQIPFANGSITKNLGEAGLIDPETEAILVNNDIDCNEFSEKVLQDLPDPQTWQVTAEELERRRDFRSTCVFSVDPATARDLDDALSCRPLEDGTFEVGVHIADVSHFITEGSALDKVALDRATSVYLTQKVIPMLPRVLCEELCSLNPGVERLAYSVVWVLDKDGNKLREWFGRSVIRSCTKLSYEHAQKMIEIDDFDSLHTSDFPDIHDKQFSLKHISQTVKNLYNISKRLREERFSSGALDFNETDIGFDLDKSTGMPNVCSLYEYKDSNRMIEEFMLLANMSVGEEIYRHHPKRSILRCHPPPHQVLIQQVEEVCRKYEIPFDGSDSASVNKSLKDLMQEDEEDEERKETIIPAINLLCMKSFKNAKYFCTGSIDDESGYRHYALNVPIYTHFTSPIRRYPDILVHRLLTSSLDQSFKFEANTKQLQKWAEHCTSKKLNADAASDQSSHLFLSVYVMEHGPLVEKGVVVNLSHGSVDVLCPQIGIMSRVYFKDVEEIKDFKYASVEDRPSVALKWKSSSSLASSSDDEDDDKEVDDQEISMFSPVRIMFHVSRDSPTKIVGKLVNQNDKVAIGNISEHASPAPAL